MDYDLERCTRHCAATGRELNPGEPYYTALVEKGTGLERLDYCVEGWQGPPPDAVGWWKSQRPEPGKRPPSWAPNDIMLDFFERLEGQPDKQDLRYVLALLLVRRRVLRLEETETDASGVEQLSLYCPRRETNFKIAAVVPQGPRVDEIQREMERLLQ